MPPSRVVGFKNFRCIVMGHRQTKTFLTLGFLALGLLFLAVVGVWTKTVSTNNNNLLKMSHEQDQRHLIFSMRDASHQRALSLYRMANMSDPFERDEEYLRFKQFAVQFISARQTLLEHYLSEPEQRIWDQIRPLIGRGEKIQNRIVDLIVDDKPEQAHRLIQEDLLPIQSTVMQELTNMLSFTRGEMDQNLHRASQESRRHYVLILVLVGVALVVGLLIANYVTKRTQAAEKWLVDQHQKIRTLYEAASRTGQTPEQQARNILRLGCEFLGLHTGVIVKTHSAQKQFEVLCGYSDNANMTFPSRMPLKNSFIETTMNSQCPTAVQSAETDGSSDQCVLLEKTKAYIAMPVLVNDSRYGVVAFLSNSVKSAPFTEADRELVRLIASWVSFTLERQQAQQQLREAKDAAESANRTKSVFLANMSHELRTPLHTIIGYSDLLKEEVEENQHTQYSEDLDIIQASGQHLLSLISNLLDLTKIEMGKIELNCETTDIAPLLDEAAVSIKPLSEKNHNSFDVTCLNNVGTVYTDTGKLRQILLNLLNNACKFTHKGKISLTAWREQCPEGDWLYLEVKDTGIGMSKKQINNLFKLFSQASPEISKNYGGSGLGLAISKKICETLGGDIVVDSEPDNGSTFTVCLPCLTNEGAMVEEAYA
jgi:signal transduction histidine kinase